MTEPYVSHPVRRMCEDPVPDGEAELIVDVAGAGSVDDPAVGRVAEQVASVGTVTERLRFGSLRVVVRQERVAALCALEGIAAVETAATRSLDAGDAGEDLDPTG